MDTTTIFSRLNASDNCNAAFILSDNFKENIAYIQDELSEVSLVYEPMSLYHEQFLALLNAMGVGIKCSNQELLDYAKQSNWKQKIIIGNEFLSSSFIRCAFAAGCTRFTVASLAEMRRIEQCVGAGNVEFILQVQDNTEDMFQCSSSPITGVALQGTLNRVEDVVEHGSLLHCILEQARAGGHNIRHVTLGSFTCSSKAGELCESILSLKNSLPAGIKLHLVLEQEILQSSLFIATRVIGTQLEENAVKYVVNISMYDELACYMDVSNDISVIPNGAEFQVGVIYGNTGEEDDVICCGVVGKHLLGDWILLKNIALADCSEFELILINKDLRMCGMEQYPCVEQVQLEQYRFSKLEQQTMPDVIAFSGIQVTV